MNTTYNILLLFTAFVILILISLYVNKESFTDKNEKNEKNEKK